MNVRPEEREIVSGARRGDPVALDRLVRDNYPIVWGAIRKFTGDGHAADPLAQEAFLRAIRAIRRFRGQSRLSTWITRIGLNLALNERRRKKSLPLSETDPAAAGPSPVEAAGDAELRARVRAGVAALPDDLRNALLLTFFGGKSHAEAGRELGCAEGTISWRVFEAKKRLREVLPDPTGA